MCNTHQVYTLRFRQPIANRDVVLYSAYFFRLSDIHINMKEHVGPKCVKYIYTYIYKGYDCTPMVMGRMDEI